MTVLIIKTTRYETTTIRLFTRLVAINRWTLRNPFM